MSSCRTRYRPQDHHDDFFASGAGLYSFCISLRSASNALPAGCQGCHKEEGLPVGQPVAGSSILASLCAALHSPTFSLFLALLSMKPAWSFLASASPSAVVTLLRRHQQGTSTHEASRDHSSETRKATTTHRSPVRSVFCPTTTHGTFSRPAKSRILSWTVWIISNDWRELIE